MYSFGVFQVSFLQPVSCPPRVGYIDQQIGNRKPTRLNYLVGSVNRTGQCHIADACWEQAIPMLVWSYSVVILLVRLL